MNQLTKVADTQTTRTRGRIRRGALAGVLAASMFVPVAFIAVSAQPASAATSPCGTVLVAAAQWLGGAGVDVHSNGADQTTGYSCAGFSTSNPQVQDGNGWQCVELAARLYAVKGWGYVHGNAAAIPQDAGLISHPNGSTYEPVPGDLIVEKATRSVPYGHVSVVDRIVGSTIYAVAQNANSTGRHTYTDNGFTITGGYAPVIDVVHSPANTHTVDVGVALRHTGSGWYALSKDGNVRPFGGAPALAGTGVALWPGQDIARAIVLRSDDRGGYVLDLYGGLHPFGYAPGMSGAPYWSGFDIARGIVLRSDNAGGYVLDGWGGIHPIGNAPAVNVSAYWSGWDIARGIVLRSDNAGGYVLDGWGGIHPFGNAPAMNVSAYWSGWDIARSIALLGNGAGGYVLDGWGGIHPLGNAPVLTDSAYWSHWDVARSLAINYSGTSGIVIDALNGQHSASVPASGCLTCS